MQKPDELKSKRRTKDIELDENVTFDDLMLSKPVSDGLKQAGFIKPSPIQLKAIPIGKLGLDLIVQAKSGTGKTCVFSILSLEQILSSKSKALQVLILAPTREVAIQISDSIKAIGHCFVKCQAFIGGQSINQDKIKLKNCQIAIGTPGRILHLIKQDLLNTSNIRLFILDEADKLLEPEFQDSINLIYSNLPNNKQIVFLSATYPTFMASYATRYMRSPTYVRLNIVDPSLRGIKQFYRITPYSNLSNKCFDFKIDELFVLRAESLSSNLNGRGWSSIYTAGHIEQNQRNFAMNQLKQFKCRILVSTDLTARGVDAQNVDLVVCMDIPGDAETYLHRIGRAGRFGSEGIAISFVTEGEELTKFDEIIDTYNLSISQYNHNLNDIVLFKNVKTEGLRKDDVTIEKAELSKEQLDSSLFEYEKSKNVRPFKKQVTRPRTKFSILSIEKVKDMLKRCDINSENQIDNLYYLEKISVKNFKQKFLNLMERMDCLTLESSQIPSKEEEITEHVDLNELYKWEQVKKVKVEINQPSRTNNFYNFYDLYSYYYQYYYNKYLNN